MCKNNGTDGEGTREAAVRESSAGPGNADLN